MFSNQNNQKDKYADDPLLALRQAACIGDMDKIKQLIQKGNIDINASGSSTGKTALHQACDNNQLEAAIFLITLGAKIGVADNSNNDPLFYCHRDNDRILLKTIYEARMILEQVAQCFPIEIKNRDEEAVKKRKNLIETEVKDDFHECCQEFKKAKSNENVMTLEPKILTSIEKIEKKLFFMMETFAYLNFLSRNNHQMKFCGEMSKMVYTHLDNQLAKGNNNEKLSIEVIRVDVTESGNHLFVVLNRDPHSDLNDFSTWGRHAVIGDPLVKQLFMINHPMQPSIIDELTKFKKEHIKNTMTASNFPEIDRKQLPKFYEAYENYLLNKNTMLLSRILSAPSEEEIVTSIQKLKI